MKAKEYYELMKNYPDNKDGLLNAVSMVIDGLNKEVKDLLESRRVKTDRAAVAVIKELNDKWNAIVALYEKDHDFCPLSRNAFLRSWIKRLPGSEKYIEIPRLMIDKKRKDEQ